jgi:Ca2+/Na+ antiporter
MGGPKSGAVWGSFLLLFCVLMYFGFSQLALVAFACCLAAFVIGMIAERREHETKSKKAKFDDNHSA